MISMNKVPKYCNNYELIENYELAISSNELWDCHHRAETDESLTRQQLINTNRYYDVHPDELIFIVHGEHTSLHRDTYRPTEETRRKMSQSKKGNTNAAGNKGRTFSEESITKMSIAKKGRRWFNNGVYQVQAFECPDGYIPGRLKFKTRAS